LKLVEGRSDGVHQNGIIFGAGSDWALSIKLLVSRDDFVHTALRKQLPIVQ
jgi:hypothetical protein